MTDYSNWKVLKSVIKYDGDDEEKIIAAQNAQAEYENAADWCDDNQDYVMSQDNEYYKVIMKPKPVTDELKAQVRAVRNGYLQDYDFTQLPDAPFTAEEKALYVVYRQYLRDYTNGENWWLQNPKTYEDWVNNLPKEN